MSYRIEKVWSLEVISNDYGKKQISRHWFSSEESAHLYAKAHRILPEDLLLYTHWALVIEHDGFVDWYHLERAHSPIPPKPIQFELFNNVELIKSALAKLTDQEKIALGLASD